RFSGVSTGACIGHIAPEALAGGPVGKVVDGDIIQIVVDCGGLEGSVDLIGQAQTPEDQRSAELGARLLAERPSRPDLASHPRLPDDTRLWAVLQEACGGTSAGCVYDVDTIVETLEAGKEAMRKD
ncbi:MAG: dihydroxy-acid dehydratase, partial [Phycisphaerales bacterium]